MTPSPDLQLLWRDAELAILHSEQVRKEFQKLKQYTEELHASIREQVLARWPAATKA